MTGAAVLGGCSDSNNLLPPLCDLNMQLTRNQTDDLLLWGTVMGIVGFFDCLVQGLKLHMPVARPQVNQQHEEQILVP